MTGILLIAVFIAWLFAAVWLTDWATRRVERKRLSLLKRGSIFVGLMALPIADEIIGGMQFRALCAQAKQVYVNKDKAFGRTITMRDPVSGYVKTNDRRIASLLPMIEREAIWRDIETNEPILSYRSLNVKGGLLIRMLGISEGNTPLLIAHTTCRPNVLGIFKEFNLKQAD